MMVAVLVVNAVAACDGVANELDLEFLLGGGLSLADGCNADILDAHGGFLSLGELQQLYGGLLRLVGGENRDRSLCGIYEIIHGLLAVDVNRVSRLLLGVSYHVVADYRERRAGSGERELYSARGKRQPADTLRLACSSDELYMLLVRCESFL